MPESLTVAVAVFVAATAMIATAGTYMARVSDVLADRTGLGEAVFGALLLAGATSLPDFAATLSATLDARPELAMSNVMGSMAANLVFLGIADIVYREANLEHAAASMANLTQAALLIVLLVLVLIAMNLPAIAVWGIHPVTPLITVGYIFGFQLIRHSQRSPMWRPRKTSQTVLDVPAAASSDQSLTALWVKFVVLTVLTAVAGWLLMEAAKVIVANTGLSENVAGGLFTAVATSSPELVTTIAAVRHGALTLAGGNIVGTNCFNIMVIAVADIGYRSGSIYHAITAQQLVWGLVTILMTAILVLGMVRRERFGIGRIGFESALMLSVYVVMIVLLVTGGA